MSAAADLERLTRAAGDVACLVAVASDLADQLDSGARTDVHVLGAVLRALSGQARALHSTADAQWMAALLAEKGAQVSAAPIPATARTGG